MQQIIAVDQDVCPVDQPLPRVLIHVEGGLDQAVYSAEELDIQVYDLDLSSFATSLETQQVQLIAAEFEQQRQGLQQIY